MTVDASRSCLGLATSIGSAIRQIVVARVLLAAAAPPALPGSSMSNGSLAPPLDAITRFFRSARCRRHAPGDGPDEAGQLAGDRGGDDIGRFAGAGELCDSAHTTAAALSRRSRGSAWVAPPAGAAAHG